MLEWGLYDSISYAKVEYIILENRMFQIFI